MANPYTIEDVVDIQISLAARPITQAGFETPIIVAAHNVFTDRARTYNDADTAVSDGFAANSGVVSMLTDLFAGDQAPSEVVVGRRVLTDYDAQLDAGVEGDVYTLNVTVNAFVKTFSYTVAALEDETDAATALAAAIEGDGDIGGLVDATAATDTVSIAPTVSTDKVSVGAGTTNVTVRATSAEAVATTMAAIADETEDWFFILSDSHVDQDLLDFGSYAEANKKMYVTSSQNSDIWTSSTGDILSQLGDLSYDNTHFRASKLADKEWPEAAIVGAMASITPGASTLFAKTLKGVTIDTFTRTEGDFVLSKNGNIYPKIAGVGWYKDGKQVSGQFFDVIRGALFTEARMEEAIFTLIKARSDLGLKIPYTQSGIDLIAATVRDQLTQRVADGFLAEFPRPKVNVPKVSDVDANDKINRVLNDLSFEAVLAGAVHTVVIKGFIVADDSLLL